MTGTSFTSAQMIGSLVALAAAFGCVTEDGVAADDEAELDEAELDTAAEVESELGAATSAVAAGCQVAIAAPFDTGPSVIAEPWVGQCSVSTFVQVVIRIDRTLWPDKTIAEITGSLFAGESLRPFSLGTRCNAQNERKVFAEVRLSNALGSGKVQSARTIVWCD